LLTQKADLLSQYKKGVMQQIFKQELRSRDDDGQEFPEWEEKRLGDISVLITKGTTPKRFSYEGINFIKIECFDGNLILKEKCAFIEDVTHQTELNRSILFDGDILFAIAGSIGKCNIVTADILPTNTNQALAIVRLKENENRKYIYHLLSSYKMQKYIGDNISVGAQPNLNLEQMGNFNINYPSLPEQRVSHILCK
jgi:type I restriction enzyme S subunit